MADNFLEKHREEYEQRKARYMSHGSHLSKEIKEMIAKKKAENKTTS
ncbi:MAG: dehydrogenase [Prevotella sp.]|nr:dehydrogenase [Prevotella sp.]MCI7089759.1 dehydrogenase [Prevotella sp.]MCI7257576.1 dehydrogenase [Prevotella sp.]MDD5784372.1 dehydrogenase [Prevotella sp.]MDD6863841.1 dehydrogenase [Prevotella sp.]